MIGLLVGLRIALPSILRAVLVRGASSVLHTRVELGDVDLALLRGGIALENLAIDAPEAAGATSDRSRSALISWKRLAIELHWWPLFHHIVQLRQISLEEPHIDVKRLNDGALNLAALIPKSEPAAPTPTTEQKPAGPSTPWGFGVDHISLRAGALNFR
ncbi:MAG TPA: AsmA family protein, partial [Candidatus Acidoferrales bacterium]|nr:AsmA family protein [Candidatus Acidoferrales bacterium]